MFGPFIREHNVTTVITYLSNPISYILTANSRKKTSKQNPSRVTDHVKVVLSMSPYEQPT